MLNETYRAMLGHKSVIRETFMYGKQRAAEIGYENVFDYSLGNPSVPCPDKFTKAMQTLLAEEEPVALHGYCPSQGDPGFRTAVAAHLAKTFGLPYEQKDIFPTTGAAGAIAHAIRAVTKPGDEVLTFAPYFPEYGPYVEGTGAVLKVVPPQAPAFQPNLDAFEEMLTENVTCVLINTPNNPTGSVMTRETLAKIAELAVKHDLLVISDDVYNTLLYAGEEAPCIASFPGMKERTVIVNSFSKSYAMTGWRIGFVAAPAEIVDRMTKCQENFNACANAPGQYAATVALDHPELCEELRQIFERRRSILLDGLAKIDGIRCNRPNGAFYVFADISSFGLSSVEFCNRLLDEQKVVCIPGSAFGECGEGFIRIAYTCSDDELHEALKRISRFCSELRAA